MRRGHAVRDKGDNPVTVAFGDFKTNDFASPFFPRKQVEQDLQVSLVILLQKNSPFTGRKIRVKGEFFIFLPSPAHLTKLVINRQKKRDFEFVFDKVLPYVLLTAFKQLDRQQAAFLRLLYKRADIAANFFLCCGKIGEQRLYIGKQ